MNVIIGERKIRTTRRHQRYQQHVASVTPVVNVSPTTVTYQRPSPQGNQGQSHKREAFDSILMSYAELLSSLTQKKLVQTKSPTTIPSPLPWYYKADQACNFHQGALGNNIENCYPLKSKV